MPTATNDGVRIHYEVEGSGPPVLLHVGFMGRIEDWYQAGYVEALKDDYQLILPDPRGQGRSDKPHDPAAYTMATRVADVVSVLDDLGIPQAHFFGYSMGARIGFDVGIHAPERFACLILGGGHPYRVEHLSDGEIALLQQGVQAWVEAVERKRGPIPPVVRNAWLDNDGEALAAYLITQGNEGSFADDVPHITRPSLIYSGTEDDSTYSQAKQAAEILPNATFISLDGLNHAQVFRSSETVVPHIRAFLGRFGIPP